MPTYEYGCESCDSQFEVFQSITAEPVAACPSCGSMSTQRLISGGAGFLFKGSGFYITDYRSNDYKQKAKSDTSSGSPSSSESAPSAEKTTTTEKAPSKTEPAAAS